MSPTGDMVRGDDIKTEVDDDLDLDVGDRDRDGDGDIRASSSEIGAPGSSFFW